MSASLTLVDVNFSLVEARVDASMLEAHGIFAHSPCEFVAVQPHLMMAHGGLPLWVPASQAEDARALLAAGAAADIGPPPPRRRVLEGLAGAILFLNAGVTTSGPADAYSQLARTGPLALFLVALALLTAPELWAGLLLGMIAIY